MPGGQPLLPSPAREFLRELWRPLDGAATNAPYVDPAQISARGRDLVAPVANVPRVELGPRRGFFMLLTPGEAARFLAVRRNRIYELAREGRLPGAVHIGRQLRVSEAALRHFIERGGERLPGGWRRAPTTGTQTRSGARRAASSSTPPEAA